MTVLSPVSLIRRGCIGILFSLVWLFGLSWGIVAHTDDFPPDRPLDSFVGRWNTNASCVAIGPNHVVTTRHQNGGVGTIVNFNGIPYKVIQESYIKHNTTNYADIRVARIITTAGEPANLTEFAPLYISNEIGKTIILGGYGKYRGTSIAGGYLWQGTDNLTLRWGQNEIDDFSQTQATSGGTIYLSQTLVCDFDYYNTSLYPYEAAAAEWDSGGGWFILSQGKWKLAAISAYVQSYGQTLYSPSDSFSGVRISSYNTTISDYISSDSHIISGMVLTYTGQPVADATITSTNEAGYTRSNSAGYYEFWVKDGWTGQIAATKTGYAFPGYLDFSTTVSSDIPNQNFVSDVRYITGYITELGRPLQGVSVVANNYGTTDITDINGFYEVAVPAGWSGTVTPQMDGVVFNPQSRSYTSVNSDIVDSYTAQALFFDDFNNIRRSSKWLKKIGGGGIDINQPDQTLQITCDSSEGSGEAVYSANEWTISCSTDFSLKVDFYNELMTDSNSEVFLRITDINNSNNFISIAANSHQNQRYYIFKSNLDGDYGKLEYPRSSDSGQLCISFDKDTSSIFLSHIAYDMNFSDYHIAIPVVAGLKVELSGIIEGSIVSPNLLWLDNFTVNTGQIENFPPKTDINQDGFIDINDLAELSLNWLTSYSPADINGDGIVDFKDIAKFSEVW